MKTLICAASVAAVLFATASLWAQGTATPEGGAAPDLTVGDDKGKAAPPPMPDEPAATEERKPTPPEPTEEERQRTQALRDASSNFSPGQRREINKMIRARVWNGTIRGQKMTEVAAGNKIIYKGARLSDQEVAVFLKKYAIATQSFVREEGKKTLQQAKDYTDGLVKPLERRVSALEISGIPRRAEDYLPWALAAAILLTILAVMATLRRINGQYA